jgi:hypothetical protein
MFALVVALFVAAPAFAQEVPTGAQACQISCLQAASTCSGDDDACRHAFVSCSGVCQGRPALPPYVAAPARPTPAAAPSGASPAADCWTPHVACTARCESAMVACTSPCDGVTGACWTSCTEREAACDRSCDEDRWACEG